MLAIAGSTSRPFQGRPGAQRGGCRRTPATRRPQLVASAQRGAAEESDVSRRAALSAGLIAGCLLSLPSGTLAAPQSAYDFTVMQYGKERTLEEFKGQNRNYKSLRALYDEYREAGFNLIAFPCNQFGSQAPETSDGERQIAQSKFGFLFPIMDKIEVNGKNAHPLYTLLKKETRTGDLEWNYVKFLVDRNGHPVKRFPSLYDPIDFEDDVRLLLAGKEGLLPECKRHPGRKACKLDSILAG